jgi:hypothetical protein
VVNLRDPKNLRDLKRGKTDLRDPERGSKLI